METKMKEYKITETLTYYVEAEDADTARELFNKMDKADAKRHNLEIEIA